MNRIIESVRLAGRVTIRDAKTGLILFQDHNVITLNGRDHVAKLIAGTDSRAITRMSIGDGGAPTAYPLIPVAPTTLDTGLVNELIVQDQDLGFPLPVASNKVTYEVTFSPAAVLGTFISPSNKVVNEIALFTSDHDPFAGVPVVGVCFSRRTFPSLNFDSGAGDPTVTVTWDVYSL